MLLSHVIPFFHKVVIIVHQTLHPLHALIQDGVASPPNGHNGEDQAQVPAAGLQSNGWVR